MFTHHYTAEWFTDSRVKGAKMFARWRVRRGEHSPKFASNTERSEHQSSERVQ